LLRKTARRVDGFAPAGHVTANPMTGSNLAPTPDAPDLHAFAS
jgi:hypothetical protein